MKIADAGKTRHDAVFLLGGAWHQTPPTDNQQPDSPAWVGIHSGPWQESENEGEGEPSMGPPLLGSEAAAQRVRGDTRAKPCCMTSLRRGKD